MDVGLNTPMTHKNAKVQGTKGLPPPQRARSLALAGTVATGGRGLRHLTER